MPIFEFETTDLFFCTHFYLLRSLKRKTMWSEPTLFTFKSAVALCWNCHPQLWPLYCWAFAELWYWSAGHAVHELGSAQLLTVTRTVKNCDNNNECDCATTNPLFFEKEIEFLNLCPVHKSYEIISWFSVRLGASLGAPKHFFFVKIRFHYPNPVSGLTTIDF